MNIDIEKTRAYYASLSPDTLCDCEHCRLFYAKAGREYPALAEWLDGYGINIAKPFEVMYIGPDENGVVDYLNVQYLAFGSCPEDFSCKVGEVEVGFCSCHPTTEINEEHFVLDAYPMKLKLD